MPIAVQGTCIVLSTGSSQTRNKHGRPATVRNMREAYYARIDELVSHATRDYTRRLHGFRRQNFEHCRGVTE